MSRLQRMTDLARRLAAATRADDWDAAAAADRELAAELAAWNEPARWSLVERTALSELRDIHGELQVRCADELRRHDRQLDAMRARREGWMAYGLQAPSAPRAEGDAR